MNRIFRLIWSEKLGAFVAASETAKGKGKNSSSASPYNEGPAGGLADKKKDLGEYRKRFRISFSCPEAEDRAELEQFIYISFKRAYGADVKHFMPLLMSLRNAKGDLLAVCGMRSAAAGEKLFLETYLDEPIDIALSKKVGVKVKMEDIVEIGNMAACRPGMARQLIAELTVHLNNIGVGWVIFTANPRLRNTFTRLGICLVPIQYADKSRLDSHTQVRAGTYFGTKPYVMAGNVQEGYPQLLENLRHLEHLP